MRGEGGAESDEDTTMAQRQSMDSTRAHSSLYYFMILTDLYYGILSRDSRRTSQDSRPPKSLDCQVSLLSVIGINRWKRRVCWHLYPRQALESGSPVPMPSLVEWITCARAQSCRVDHLCEGPVMATASPGILSLG
jgi:hypothetical protein